MSSKVYFLHANGIPAKTYGVFFEALAAKDILYKNCIGLSATKDKQIKSWKPFRDEVINDLIEKKEKGLVAIGHSMGGAVAMMAEAQVPGLFSKIILLDPVLIRPAKSMIAQLSNFLGLADAAPILKKARNRTDQFISREAASIYWQRRSFFQRFEENSFSNYLEYGLKANDQGFELTIPKDHEYQVFKTGGNKIDKLNSSPPIHLIRAQKGSVMDKRDIAWIKKRIPEIEIQESEGTHMFPLEQPVKTAELINSFL